MADSRRLRELEALAQGAGLALERIEQGGRHLRLHVRAPDGATALFFASVTPSDHRGDLNKRALMRRFAKDHHA